jgi:hypothetical protein
MAEEPATGLVESLRRRIIELEAQCAPVPTGKGAPIYSADINGAHVLHSYQELTRGVSLEDILAHLTEAFIVLECHWRIIYVNADTERINRKKQKTSSGQPIGKSGHYP